MLYIELSRIRRALTCTRTIRVHLQHGLSTLAIALPPAPVYLQHPSKHGILITPYLLLTALCLQSRQASRPLSRRHVRRIHHTATAGERTTGAGKREDGKGKAGARRAKSIDGGTEGRNQRSSKTISSKRHEPWRPHKRSNKLWEAYPWR